MEDLRKVFLKEGDEEKYFLIGSPMSETEQEKTTSFLRRNVDVFAWDAAEMKDINSEVITHRLHGDPNHNPGKQRPRHTTPNHTQVVKEKMDRLLEVDGIRRYNSQNGCQIPSTRRRKVGSDMSA